MDASRNFALGISGWKFADLYDASKLERLFERFHAEMAAHDQNLTDRYDRWRGGEALAEADKSALLLQLAEPLGAFIARLFAIDAEAQACQALNLREQAVFAFKEHFINKRVRRRKAPLPPPMADALRLRLEAFWSAATPAATGAVGHAAVDDDAELRAARCAMGLLQLWQVIDKRPAPSAEALEDARVQLQNATGMPIVAEALRETAAELLLALESWHHGRLQSIDWASYRTRAPTDQTHQALVRLAERSDAAAPDPDDGTASAGQAQPADPYTDALSGPLDELRARDGFALTDARMPLRDVHDEVHACLICHPRQKDSCRRGLHDRAGAIVKTPLGTPLQGCPLDERISEAHQLFAAGHSIAALAMVMRDNPMCPGTGHRICNDCMKACIFQKQEPINVPEVETHLLTQVLSLPYGFEIYALLTRFNPLREKRPFAAPYNGFHALVVGLGPAGYTLAHYLLNEGFGVVGIDGLKLEPMAEALTGSDVWPPQAVRDIEVLQHGLDTRPAAGFGGVAEYGITVRWDKNFLQVIYLNLLRWQQFRAFGGIRFGSTVSLEDAWDMGFDHVALAAGAGKPTLVKLKNNMMRGMRAASDFLMGLQLTGAFRADSLANLQVELPAVVIGGGLTAFDTATELAAYYPVQVEKLALRVDSLGEEAILASLDPEERATFARMLGHARELRAARAAGTADVPGLVRKWGGVCVAYRRALTDSPAYRLNHEEVQKALEEGIYVREHVTPHEAVPDAFGHVDGLVVSDADGMRKVLPARAIIMAAGTAPNTIYAREYPGSLPLDAQGRFFLAHRLRQDAAAQPSGDNASDGATAEAAAWQLEPVEGRPLDAFFAGARGPQRSADEPPKLVSFLGDNHPGYAGNVVRAMASAKRGHVAIVQPFARAIAARLQSGGVPASRFTELCTQLHGHWGAQVVAVNRLTPTIVEVVVRAPKQAEKFLPGQFFRLQNYERDALRIGDISLNMEGLALTGAWVDVAAGTIGMVALEMGVSSRLCGQLRPGQEVVLMGPTGTGTEIPENESVLLCGGGLGNAVLFSVAQALRARGNRVLYFAAYRRETDMYKQSEVEAASDQVVWSVDQGPAPAVRRPQDRAFVGNIVQALQAFAKGELGEAHVSLGDVDRIITIGSDRMMAAVAQARRTSLAAHLKPAHEAIASINSPMQCMMKEVCAQCLQRHVDPVTGEESFVFSCFNQDQRQDVMDWQNLAGRLRQNTLMEKVSGLYLDHLWQRGSPVADAAAAVAPAHI